MLTLFIGLMNDDAPSNESGHVLLFPFIDDLAFLYIITQYN